MFKTLVILICLFNNHQMLSLPETKFAEAKCISIDEYSWQSVYQLMNIAGIISLLKFMLYYNPVALNFVSAHYLSVHMPFVSTHAICQYICHLFVSTHAICQHMPFVSTYAICLSVHMPFVSTYAICLSVHMPFVSTYAICKYTYHSVCRAAKTVQRSGCALYITLL